MLSNNKERINNYHLMDSIIICSLFVGWKLILSTAKYNQLFREKKTHKDNSWSKY